MAVVDFLLVAVVMAVAASVAAAAAAAAAVACASTGRRGNATVVTSADLRTRASLEPVAAAGLLGEVPPMVAVVASEEVVASVAEASVEVVAGRVAFAMISRRANAPVVTSAVLLTKWVMRPRVVGSVAAEADMVAAKGTAAKGTEEAKGIPKVLVSEGKARHMADRPASRAKVVVKAGTRGGGSTPLVVCGETTWPTHHHPA